MSLARRTLLVAALLLPTAAAFAQSAPVVTRIRGTVVGFADSTLTVATREGPNVSITLPGTLAPSALKRMSMTDIKPNSFIATVAAPDASGHALLARAAEQGALTARGWSRVLRLARTIADLDGSTGVRRRHVAESLGYRRATFDPPRTTGEPLTPEI